MWGTIFLLIIIVALLMLQIIGFVAGRLMWWSNLVYIMWLLYFIVICCLFLYREQKHGAKAGSVFKLHDRLLAQAQATSGTTPSAAAPEAASNLSASGDTLADEDKML
jgi:MFS-type transporter involved in bile tolerance (Atg22 family)